MRDPDHKTWVYENMKVHYITYERSRDNENENRYDEPRRGSASQVKPWYTVFCLFVGKRLVDTNTAANRELWAKGICNLNNSPAIQRAYRYGNNNTLSFAADVTPVAGPLPFLSQFLTIRETMEAIKIAYKDPVTNVLAAEEDIIDNLDILKLYYSPEQIPRAVALFAQIKASPQDQFGIGVVIPEFNI